MKPVLLSLLITITLSVACQPTTPTPTATLSYATKTVGPTLIPTTPTPSLLITDQLDCEKHSELSQIPEQKEPGAYQLALDEQDDIFILDRTNKLVFRLSRNGNAQVIQLGSEWTHCLWNNIGVRGNRLYLLISECQTRTRQFVRALLVSPLDGSMEQVINLDAYQTLARKAVVDENGGVYVTDEYHVTVYIDSKSQVIPVTVGKTSHNSDYEIASGWDGNLYTYSYDFADQADDELANWGSNGAALLASMPMWVARDVILPRHGSKLEVGKDLLGVDAVGRVYFHSYGEYKPRIMPQPKGHFARLSTQYNRLEIGQLPDELILSAFSFGVAPSITFVQWQITAQLKLASAVRWGAKHQT